MVKSGLFVIFLLSGGAASASYSEDNAKFYDDFEDKCTDKDYNQYDAVEDACDDVKRVSSAQAASAVSYRILCREIVVVTMHMHACGCKKIIICDSY